MHLLNGENKQSIEISDRGLQYGDGLFETIEVLNGTPIFLNQHLTRLSKGCQALQLPKPDFEILRKEASLLCQNSSKAVLKLIITRGTGGRGYAQPKTVQPTRLLSLHPFPSYPERFFKQGVTLKFCYHRLGLNSALAGIKHLNRLEQVLARAEWSDSDIQEGLMLDINDNVIEGTMSNFFLVKQKTMYTSMLTFSGVSGIVRNMLIALAREKQIKVLEKNISKEEIYAADELFVCNSIIGIWPVKLVEMQAFKIGSVTKKLQNLWLRHKQEALNES